MKSKNNILLWLALTWVMLWAWQNLSAQTQKFIKNSENNLTELFDNLDHEQILKSKISDLVAKYWLEQSQEIVREHSIIEINKYRSLKWVCEYKQNNILQKSAQKHADDMSKNNYFDHKNLEWKHVWDRLEDIWWYNYQYLWENISNDDNIYEVIESYFKSKKWWHEEIFDWKYEDIWLWIASIETNSWDYPKYYFVFDFAKKFKSEPPLDIVWLLK